MEAFYGGAAGGGKSEGLLMGGLQYVHRPEYAGIIFRKTYSDLALPGALMDRAEEWLSETDAWWDGQDHTWRFPSGATLTFGYLDKKRDRYRYQSAEFQYIAFDELTQFPERDYLYLFSRLRRKAGSPIPLRMRAGSNPGNIGHEWVRDRFVDPQGLKRGELRTDRVFIPAFLEDNPHLDLEPYIKSLNQLDPITREQYLAGRWDIEPEGMVAKRSWFNIVDLPPAGSLDSIRAWDLAATEASLTSGDPDYLVGTLLSSTRDGIYTIEHVVRDRPGPAGAETLVLNYAKIDGRQVPIVIELEPGASAKILAASIIRKLAGWSVSFTQARKGKIARATPFLNQAESGNVNVVRGPWVKAWLDEICTVPQGVHDDQFDSAALGFNRLTSEAGRSGRSYQG